MDLTTWIEIQVDVVFISFSLLEGFSNAGVLGNVEYPFIAIAVKSTLAWSGSIWKGPIYWSNRTVWYLNWVQTNDVC